jgi:hypothetical protein
MVDRIPSGLSLRRLRCRIHPAFAIVLTGAMLIAAAFVAALTGIVKAVLAPAVRFVSATSAVAILLRASIW